MQYNLKVIKSLVQYTDYCNIHESLMIADSPENGDIIELLELLISDFDNKRDISQRPNSVELLRELIDESWGSQLEFAKEIDLSPQTISDILTYRRPFSKKTAFKLADFFALKKVTFLFPYNLETERKTFLDIKSKVEKHELEIIEGIGPKIAVLLSKNGISTINKLARFESQAVKNMLMAINPRYARYKTHSWIQQSKSFLQEKKAKTLAPTQT